MQEPPPLPKKLLPFPWIFCTRSLARKMIEHIESCHRIIDQQTITIMRLQSEMNRPCQPPLP